MQTFVPNKLETTKYHAIKKKRTSHNDNNPDRLSSMN